MQLGNRPEAACAQAFPVCWEVVQRGSSIRCCGRQKRKKPVRKHTRPPARFERLKLSVTRSMTSTEHPSQCTYLDELELAEALGLSAEQSARAQESGPGCYRRPPGFVTGSSCVGGRTFSRHGCLSGRPRCAFEHIRGGAHAFIVDGRSFVGCHMSCGRISRLCVHGSRSTHISGRALQSAWRQRTSAPHRPYLDEYELADVFDRPVAAIRFRVRHRPCLLPPRALLRDHELLRWRWAVLGASLLERD